MTHKQNILASLTKHGPLCDDCLSEETRIKPRQTINIACRSMEKEGELLRVKDSCPRCKSIKILNRLVVSGPTASPKKPVTANTIPDLKSVSKNHDVEALSEDEIKEVLVGWLRNDGWEPTVAWGNTRGIDIEATRGPERWVIEVKGPGSRQPMRVNYFIGILGETLQRMDDPNAWYSIALPDLPQYRGLWDRLPDLAKSRTRISIIFVAQDGRVEQDGEY